MRLPTSESATGKTIKVLFWVGVSAIVTQFVSMVTKDPSLFNPYVVMAVNVLGKFAVEFINKETPNY